jgi:hypothetical protein
LSLRTSTRCSNALRDEANHLTDFWTVTVNLGQDCRWRSPEALQVEEPAGFTTPEGSPRQVGLRRHRHSHANRPEGIEKLEASDREIVSIINTHVSKALERSGKSLTHDGFSPAQSVSTGISTGSRTGHDGAQFVPELCRRCPFWACVEGCQFVNPLASQRVFARP